MKNSIRGLFGTLLLLSLASMAGATDAVISIDSETFEYYINILPTTEDANNRSGTTVYNIPNHVESFKVYDDGGKNGNYGMPTTKALHVCLDLNAPENAKLLIEGTSRLDPTNRGNNQRDWFGIYVDDKIVGSYYGESSVVYMTSGNSVELCLHSYAGGNDNGLDLLVTVLKKNEISIIRSDGGTIACDKNSAYMGDTVTVTATPESGNVLSDVGIGYKSANYTGNYISNFVPNVNFTTGTAKFVMPNSAASLKGVFTKLENVQTENAYLNMPSHARQHTSSEVANIPEGVSSFKVYDDGGKYGTYEIGESSLRLVAPSKYGFRITGNVVLGISDYTNAYLTIYDGVSGSKTLLSKKTSSFNGVATDIGTLVSSKNIVELYLFANYTSIPLKDGLDLNVEVLPSITVATVENGSVVSDKKFAKSGETVTLTPSPETGFILESVTIVDANGNDVETSESDGVVTFAMSKTPVTVTPKFSFSPEIHFVQTENGNVQVAQNAVVVPGNVVSVIATPEEGFYCQKIKVVNETTEMEISATLDPDASTTGNASVYNFTMPKNAVSVTATFANIPNIVLQADPNGDIESNVTQALPNTEVSLTATPAEGYLFVGVELKNKDGEKIGNMISSDNWFMKHTTYDVPNTLSFSMPDEGDVYVYPVFKNSLTYRDGIALNLPANGIKKISVPAAINSFYVYDDGGKDGSYSNTASGSVVFTAPEGSLLQLMLKLYSIKATVGEQHDYLTVYDGDVYSDASVPRLLRLSGNTTYTIAFSSGNSITVYFESLNVWETDGFEMSVTVVKPRYGAVTLKNTEDGLTAEIDGGYTESDTLDIPESITVNAVDFKRTFSTNGNGFSTVMFPFSTSGWNLEGVDAVLTFAGIGTITNAETGKKDTVAKVSYVWCSDALAATDSRCENIGWGTLNSYTPYMVKVNDEHIGINGSVTISSTMNVDPETRVGDWVFRGTLAKKTWEEGGADLGKAWGYAATDANVSIGDFAKVGAGAWINPFRAYVAYDPQENPEQYAPVPKGVSYAPQTVASADVNLPDRLPVVIVDQNGEIEEGEEHTTVIGSLNTRTGEILWNAPAKRTYDLKGRNVGKPKAKGLYLKR